MLPPPKICQRIQRLFALLGSPNANEAANARDKLKKLLERYGLNWNDLPPILAVNVSSTTSSSTATSSSSSTGSSAAAADAPAVNVFDLVLALVEQYIAVTHHEAVAITLWILHTYVYDRYAITPRLTVLSPVWGCGKSTLLILMELLTAKPYRSDNITPAAIYHELDRNPGSTMLLDEGDNLGIFNNAVLRAVFNSGHMRGGSVSRFVGGWSRRFSTHAPLAVAAIGTLTGPLLHRSVIIRMHRPAPDQQISPFDANDPAFPAARDQIGRWAAATNLAPDPPVPLRNRARDNWRVLLAIADDLEHGDAARAAAVALSAGHQDEDPGVMLLVDVRRVLMVRGVDRISCDALVAELIGLDDAGWAEWTGRRDDRPPHKLTRGELLQLLRPFGIRAKTVWPLNRQAGDKSFRGVVRAQFEAAWARFCPEADTSPQASVIRELGRHSS